MAQKRESALLQSLQRECEREAHHELFFEAEAQILATSKKSIVFIISTLTSSTSIKRMEYHRLKVSTIRGIAVDRGVVNPGERF